MDEARNGAADRLMSALQQDEFVLYTQSIIPLTKADEHPFREIFIRLKEEDDKLLPPGTFFPILQEAGMLPTLDRWIVNRLARWVRTTLDAEPKAKIPRYNVNLSTRPWRIRISGSTSPSTSTSRTCPTASSASRSPARAPRRTASRCAA
jgi:EAL domain-containing protein (putative c-di-GMP-specific phosphodiesterase class I)